MFRITIPPRTILAELPGAFPTCYDLFIVVLVIHRILNSAVLWEQVPYFFPYLFAPTRPDQKLQKQGEILDEARGRGLRKRGFSTRPK